MCVTLQSIVHLIIKGFQFISHGKNGESVFQKIIVWCIHELVVYKILENIVHCRVFDALGRHRWAVGAHSFISREIWVLTVRLQSLLQKISRTVPHQDFHLRDIIICYHLTRGTVV